MFSDVAIDAIRENVSIPVIGPGETTLAVANMLCNKFTVITTESTNIPRTYRRLMRNGIAREKPYLLAAITYYILVMILTLFADRLERWVRRSDQG